MIEGSSPKPSRRVIALLPAAAAGPEAHSTIELVRVRSGYEAAAEMLSAPTAALLVDLGRIGPTHLPLLALARKLEMPVVAFGTISADLPTGDIRQLTLVSPPGVSAALADALHLAEPEPVAEAAVEAPPAEPAVEEAAAAEEPARPVPASLQARTPAAQEGLSQAELDALLGDAP